MGQVTVKRDFKKFTYSFVFGAAVESVEVAIDPALGIKGEVVKMIIVIPDWVNTVTAVVSMINSDAKEVFAGVSKAQNDEYDVVLDRNECVVLGQTGEKWKVTLSGVPGGTGDTVTVTPYLGG
jgi:hypothetical protein